MIMQIIFAEGIPSFDKDAFIKSAEENKIIELSLRECILLSVKNNSEIKIKRIEPLIAKDKIKKAEGAFEPTFKAYYEYDETNEPGSAPTLTGNTEDKSRRKDYNIGIEGKLFTNTEYDINWDNYTYSSNSRLQRFYPDYNSSLNGTITQPVLKDFIGMSQDQADIVIAKNNMEISDFNFENEVINIVSRTKNAYLDYVHNTDQAKLADTSLQTAQNLKNVIQQRYNGGLASSADLLEIEAAVAKKEERMLFFEKQLKKSEDELKLITNLIDDPDLWNAAISATDSPTQEIRDIELVQSIKDAFSNRPDYKAAKADLKNKDINIKTAINNLLPTVDLIGTYEASGLGDKYSSAVNQVSDGTYGSWSAGVSVKVPFGFAEEMADFRISKLEKEKAIIAFTRLEQKIILEVRDSCRNAEIAQKDIKAAKKRLDTEEKKFKAAEERLKSGLISTYELLQYQEDFDAANLIYLQAIIEYNKALVNIAKSKGTALYENNIKIE